MNIKLRHVLLKNNILFFKGKGKKKPEDNTKLVLAIINSFLSLGFKLDEKAIKILNIYNKDSLTNFYNSSIPLLKEISSVKDHFIFYKNFPNLENISEFEYIVRANLHYLTATNLNYGFVNQDISSDKVETEEEGNNYTTLKILVNKNAYLYLRDYFTNLFKGDVAINRNLYEAIKIFRTYDELGELTDIPFKENIACFILTKNGSLSLKDLAICHNVTDILRIYCILSDGKTIIRNNKFKSLPRMTRRNIVKRLEELCASSYVLDDFLRHEVEWKNAFNYLHIFEYKEIAPKVCAIANEIRNGKLRSFRGILETKKKNQEDYLKMLSTKPGEFARSLNYLLSIESYDSELTLSYFSKIVSSISTKVLLELYTYFNCRNSLDFRLFKIPTSYNFAYYQVENKLKTIPNNIISDIIDIIIKGLINKFENYNKLDKVYVDESLKNVVIPLIIRNSSLVYDTFLYGTKIKLEEQNYLRVFTTWKNENNVRQDIDLAMEVYDEKFNQIANLSWHNMSGGKKFDAYHSGDLVTAPLPLGASEFIDINLIKARTQARYLIITNTIFSGLSYDKLSYCYSGVMLSEYRLKKLIDPKSIYIKAKLCQESSLQNVAFVIDLKTLELIWVDMPLDSYYGSTTYGSLGVKSLLVDVLKPRMNLYDFIMLHNKHINFVDNSSEAEIIIANTDTANINPTDLAKFSLDWF